MHEDPKLYDLSFLRKITCGDETALKKMIGIFLMQIPSTLSSMEQAILEGDHETIESVAHRFKTNVEVMGIQGLQARIESIEMMGQAKTAIEEITVTFNIFKSGLLEVQAGLLPLVA